MRNYNLSSNNSIANIKAPVEIACLLNISLNIGLLVVPKLYFFFGQTQKFFVFLFLSKPLNNL